MKIYGREINGINQGSYLKLCDYSIYTYVYVLGDLIHAAQYMIHYGNICIS